MRAIKVTGKNQYEFCDENIPSFNDEQVLIKVEYSALCSSDVKLIGGDYHGLVYPAYPGHEWSGIVHDAPAKYKDMIGKKVVVDILFPCLSCEQCRNGNHNLCVNMNEIGQNIRGGFSEYLAVNISNVVVLPDNMSLKHACIIETLAVAYYAVKRVGGIKPAEKVTILGSGAVGLLVTALVKLSGASEIIVVDKIESRLKIAKELGATKVIHEDHKNIIGMFQNQQEMEPDIVFDATGEAQSLNTALEIVKGGGTVGYISYTGYERVSVQPSNIMVKRLNIFGVLSPTQSWTQAVDIVNNHMIDIDKLITHEFEFNKFEDLLNLMSTREDGIVRGVIKF